MHISITLDEKSLKQTVLELLCVFSLSMLYFYLITILSRYSLIFECILCIGLPLMIHTYNQYIGHRIHYRILQLILIESTFMLFVILGKMAIQHNNVSFNLLLGYGFRLLFFIQFVFFMLYQYKVKSYFGLIRTALFLVLLIPWFRHTDLASQMDNTGRFFFAGVQAPDYIITYYCCWVIGVPLVDSRTLPNFLTACLHFASVLVALISQEFFHARLLTASHLFILDYLLSYSEPEGKQIGVINHKQFTAYNTYIRPLIDKLTLTACISLFFYTFFFV